MRFYKTKVQIAYPYYLSYLLSVQFYSSILPICCNWGMNKDEWYESNGLHFFTCRLCRWGKFKSSFIADIKCFVVFLQNCNFSHNSSKEHIRKELNLILVEYITKYFILKMFYLISIFSYIYIHLQCHSFLFQKFRLLKTRD